MSHFPDNVGRHDLHRLARDERAGDRLDVFGDDLYAIGADDRVEGGEPLADRTSPVPARRIEPRSAVAASRDLRSRRYMLAIGTAGPRGGPAHDATTA